MTLVAQSYDMQCFPLYSLLLAAGANTVNYLRWAGRDRGNGNHLTFN